MTTPVWHPEAFSAISMSALERAFWYDQCRHAAQYMAIHSADQPGLTPEIIEQRKAILTIASRLFAVQRDLEMDEAVNQWRDYRAHLSGSGS